MQNFKTLKLAVIVAAVALTAACSRKDETVPAATPPDLTTAPVPSAPMVPSAASDAVTGGAAGTAPSASAVMDGASAPGAMDSASMPGTMPSAPMASMPN